MVAPALQAASDHAPSVLDPRGPGAARVEWLWWIMLAISAVVFTVVVGMLAASVVRSRRDRADPRRPDEARWGEPFIVVAGVVVPALILATMFVVSLRAMAALEGPSDQAGLEVRVTGHMWWWEARYPGGATTANEIHIPVGVPVRFAVTSADVIHSFWVPQLQVKADMIPGRVNALTLQADEPGRFRGQCAEFCGLQHANMIFWVVADSPGDFDRWLEHEAQPAAEPAGAAGARGRATFLGHSCSGCHTVQGTPARSPVGPDLTHLAARRTIGSGIMPNTRANLAGFVTDPQRAKPGTVMPPTELSPSEVEDLVAYLETLK